jgi:hypothetical protein
MKIICITLFILFSITAYAQNMWAVATMPAPVLNTPDFQSVFGGKNGTVVKTDNKGHIRELEFIALTGTVFEIINTSEFPDHKIYKVRTDEYNYNSDLYIDSRFVNVSEKDPGKRKIELPAKNIIYQFLDNAEGMPYRWGGNYIKGVDKLTEYYKPSVELDISQADRWILKGTDCSGLMYEATNGYTERNTSKLVTFGDAVDIAGMSASGIKSILKPLDMIVWNGHVIYVYDENTAIQSTPSEGVHKSELLSELKSIMRSKKPVNDYNNSKGSRFVVRRWFYE